MNAQPGDYVISRNRNASGKDIDALIKVRSVNKEGFVFGVLQVEPHTKNTQVEVKGETIIMNLGAKPHPGVVYGFHLDRLYLGSKEHPDLGEIFFFTRMKKEQREILFDALANGYKAYKKRGIDLSKLPVNREVHAPLPKYLGSYSHSKDLSKRFSKIEYCPKPTTPTEDYTYLVAHEEAHAMDFLLVRQNQKAHASWIKAYNGSIATKSISKEDNKVLVHSFAGSEVDTVKEWLSSLDEELKDPAKYALYYLRHVRGLSVPELNTLIATGNKDEIVRLWPKIGVDLKTQKPTPLVTEYATKNVHELFAESVSYNLVGKQLPDFVETLVDKSFTLAKINFKEYA